MNKRLLFAFLAFALLLGVVSTVLAENYKGPDGQSTPGMEPASLPRVGQVIISR